MKWLILIFSFSILGCKDTPPKLALKKQEQLRMVFAPSFIPILDFRLKIEKDSGEITHYVLQPRNPLTNQPPQTIVYDSLTFKVGGDAYLKFVKTIRELDVKNYKSGEQEGAELIDGLHARFEYISPSSDTTKLYFQSSNREDAKVAYELIDGFFDFTGLIFKTDKKQMAYLNDLKKYFDLNKSVK